MSDVKAYNMLWVVFKEVKGQREIVAGITKLQLVILTHVAECG